MTTESTVAEEVAVEVGYRRVLEVAHLIHRAAAAELAEVEKAIAAIERADAIGPTIDPTLYRTMAQAMTEDREVLLAVRELGRLGP